MMNTNIRRYICTVFFPVITACLSGCDAIPRDNAKALERIRKTGELRVGVSENPPWVRFNGETIDGIEPELITSWAQSLGAQVKWRRGAEAELVEALHKREIDVLAVGFDRGTPYSKEVALTRPYTTVKDRYGKKKKHAMAVTQGESALLFSFDQFLLGQDEGRIKARAEKVEAHQ